MAQDDFGRKVAELLGVSAYDRGDLSNWETGRDDFEAAILVGAIKAAGLSYPEVMRELAELL